MKLTEEQIKDIVERKASALHKRVECWGYSHEDCVNIWKGIIAEVIYGEKNYRYLLHNQGQEIEDGSCEQRGSNNKV